uniref:Uncharacterized protein n=1 Tax=Strigamia maritima TaxID=126957 RepID=T1JHM4_STRMM
MTSKAMTEEPLPQAMGEEGGPLSSSAVRDQLETEKQSLCTALNQESQQLALERPEAGNFLIRQARLLSLCKDSSTGAPRLAGPLGRGLLGLGRNPALAMANIAISTDMAHGCQSKGLKSVCKSLYNKLFKH